ncbi:TetR/AcrR family transcriptional regulator [Rhizobium sp. KVB221]|uniref:TetR/AcrR family transcriptional regulator n=1 Tax=Rhizobium setariae TaxID=2801340 RepID=A0A936YWL0_9HYPH|nr:TetR/AcrR family transcriptional regulator [Rhizobium setariae]MBL0374760.1 TetR/AcrR family transcriptional regulator [Rhizobium setariae]
MLDLDTSERRAVILDSAFKLFLAYGFRRTTMGDIAAAAGISRPALYLEFKNKADIYREGLMTFVGNTFREVDLLLAKDGPLVERIKDALSAALVIPMRAVAQSPHGAELFEIKHELADDVGHDWNLVLAGSLEKTLASAVAQEQLLLPDGATAADLARLLATCADGIKKKMTDWDQIESDLHLMAELIVRPLIKHG